MALERNVQKLQVLLQALEPDHLSREDFNKAFKALVDTIKRTRRELDDAAKKNRAEIDAGVKEALQKVDNALGKALEDVEAINNRTQEMSRSDSRLTMKMFEEKVREMRNMIEYYDDEELWNELKAVRESIPEVPDAFDPTEIVDTLEEHEKEIEELKKRPIKAGGGVTNARIIQAMKYILKTEQPSGAIDGANTTYTVSQPIFAVFAFSLNGEVIAQLPNYTIAGNTIEFSSALPAAYSGRDFEVKYI
jgi:DNA repair exonuclease SbcCD ATPase subunit